MTDLVALLTDELDVELADLLREREALEYELRLVNADIARMQEVPKITCVGPTGSACVGPIENPERYAVLDGRPVRVLFDGVSGR